MTLCVQALLNEQGVAEDELQKHVGAFLGIGPGAERGDENVARAP